MNLLGLPADVARAIAQAVEDVHTLARVAIQVPDRAVDRLPGGRAAAGTPKPPKPEPTP